MLQKIFGYKVELIEHGPDYTMVRADKPVRVGSQIPVKVSAATGRRTSALPMFILSCREAETGGYLLTGRFLVDHPDLTGFEIPEGLRSEPKLRAFSRVSCHLCVLSRDLPGFKVVTIDISEGGLQVEAPARVALGNTVLLRLEFDTESLTPVEARAKVAWCKEFESGRYRIGLQFCELASVHAKTISLFRRLHSRRGQADVQSKTVKADAAFVTDSMESDLHIRRDEIKVLEWHELPLLAGAVLASYHRQSDGLRLRLRGGKTGQRCSDYIFPGVRALHDNSECDLGSQAVEGFRFAGLGDDWYRFQLLGAEKQVLLELESRNCFQASPENN